MGGMRLSIILPVLNEAPTLIVTLGLLQRMRARGVEVLVVDGGSSDASREIARPLVDYVINSAKGRAIQMNAGAKASNGEVLLFLHADSLMPEDGDQWIAEALANGKKWGRFDVSIIGHHYLFPVIAWFINHRSRLTGIATGDQGIFAARDAFESVGGFPDQPLMEDIAFCARMLHHLGQASPAYIGGARISTSGRRWEKHGVWRTILLMWRLRLQYYLGADPIKLHETYYGRHG